jgi:hypothetical protein
VSVFRARLPLPGKQNQLPGAIPVVVDIDDQLQARPFEVIQPEVGDFEPATLLVRQEDARPKEHFCRTLLCLRDLVLCHHGYEPYGYAP